ncbi:hypothetical protein BWI17_07060 [Betaproteobacteria bacterium GR16-43]|nr:hypothetical protein BWI17_07060 [Betaproteobacteria bacterium GR16-43]
MSQESELSSAKAQLLEDFGKVVADTEALLRSLANVSGDKAEAMREAVEANLDSAKARLRELQGTVADKASGAAREADAYVHENPWTAIGIAAAVGVILGMVIGSRR